MVDATGPDPVALVVRQKYSLLGIGITTNTKSKEEILCENK